MYEYMNTCSESVQNELQNREGSCNPIAYLHFCVAKLFFFLTGNKWKDTLEMEVKLAL